MFPLQAAAAILVVPYFWPTIQAAVDDAADGDSVWVFDGVYTGDGNWNIDFNGKAITVRSASGPENCIIDCRGNLLNARRAFIFQNGEGADSVVEGFTIKRGFTYPGGAIYCNFGSSPTIRDNIFLDNTSFCYD
jgi:hypothetical protein